MKVHKVKVSQWFGGERRSSLCGRLNASCSDGMNVTEDDREVTCRFCLRNMEISRRLRAAKARRAGAGVVMSGPVRALSEQDELSLALARQRELETERDEARSQVQALIDACAYDIRDLEAAETRQRELEEALYAATRFIEEEAENRSAAGSVCSDYEREPRELAERLTALLSPPTQNGADHEH